MAVTPDDFIRIEDKYVLDHIRADEILSLAKHLLRNASPVPGTEYTVIETEYFDSPDLRSLKDYLHRATERSKVRIRNYAPNGVRSPEYFIELKSKSDGVSTKNRFPINAGERDRLLLTGNLATSLGRTGKKLDRRISRINDFIASQSARAVCKITYRRQAFEAGDFRLTLDRDLQCELITAPGPETIQEICRQEGALQLLQQTRSLVKNDNYILELKHNGSIPEPILNFLHTRKIEKETFSKYCYGMSFAILKNI